MSQITQNKYYRLETPSFLTMRSFPVAVSNEHSWFSEGYILLGSCHRCYCSPYYSYGLSEIHTCVLHSFSELLQYSQNGFLCIQAYFFQGMSSSPSQNCISEIWIWQYHLMP